MSRSGMLVQMREPKDRLCVALDVPKLAEAESLVRELRDEVGMFKIGIELYSAEGPRAVERVRELGGRVFLDLKLHDIPSAGSLRVLESTWHVRFHQTFSSTDLGGQDGQVIFESESVGVVEQTVEDRPFQM